MKAYNGIQEIKDRCLDKMRTYSTSQLNYDEATDELGKAFPNGPESIGIPSELMMVGWALATGCRGVHKQIFVNMFADIVPGIDISNVFWRYIAREYRRIALAYGADKIVESDKLREDALVCDKVADGTATQEEGDYILTKVYDTYTRVGMLNMAIPISSLPVGQKGPTEGSMDRLVAAIRDAKP